MRSYVDLLTKVDTTALYALYGAIFWVPVHKLNNKKIILRIFYFTQIKPI